MQAIADSGIARAEIFISSKIPCSRLNRPLPYPQFPNPMTEADATKYIAEDLKQMGVGYVDLMLLHWPCVTAAENAAVWRALEAAVAKGQIRAIGVSNFNASSIAGVLASATLPIAVNQCNMSAGNEDVATINYCKSMNITYEGYGALQGGKMEDPRVMSIAAKYHVDPSEVLLRWVVQQGVVSVTASLVEAYDQQDVGIFDFALTAAEMAVLAAL